MTDQRDESKVSETGVAASSSAETATPSISRRALLRGASAAVPTVLTLNSGSALAASSFWVTGSAVEDPVRDRYVCLEGAQPGVRYYYDAGATASAIHKDQWYLNASVLNGVDLSKPQKIKKAIEDAIAASPSAIVKGDQLCADGQAYIPVSETGPMYDAAGNPITQSVSVKQGALLSASAYDSLAASGKLDTYLI